MLKESGLSGPFALTHEKIDLIIAHAKPGTYALGDANVYGGLTIWRIGRSDYNVNGRLHDYVGHYRSFKWSYAGSIRDAYEKECALYHAFAPAHNTIHPDRPAGTSFQCPFCPAVR